jgi:hypothetical protein
MTDTEATPPISPTQPEATPPKSEPVVQIEVPKQVEEEPAQRIQRFFSKADLLNYKQFSF